MKDYFIDTTYIHRDKEIYLDDSGSEDRFQKEVYLKAKDLFIKHGFTKILDIGTGSGFKLIKYFSEYETLGLDLEPTVEKLRKTYPDRKWSSRFEPITGYDMISAVDVIEHLLDPDILLDFIEKCQPKLIILSTPDRNFDKINQSGPPNNIHHIREWTFEEFNQYISTRFEILEHYTSSIKHTTQLIVAKLKDEKIEK